MTLAAERADPAQLLLYGSSPSICGPRDAASRWAVLGCRVASVVTETGQHVAEKGEQMDNDFPAAPPPPPRCTITPMRGHVDARVSALQI